MVEGKKQPISQNKIDFSKNNLIGLAMFGVAVLVFCAVSYFAYQKIVAPDGDSETMQREVNSFKQAKGVNRAQSQTQPSARTKTYKRQKSISEREISGLWEAQLKSGKALLEIGKEAYRLVIIPGGGSHIRYYSNGDYKITDDLIMLTPDGKLKAPEGNYDYRSLTVARFPVVASKYKGKLVWQVPPSGSGIYIPPYHAVLDLAEDKILVWNVLE